MVASAFIGSNRDGLQVAHCNGDPTDNRVENLRYDTPTGNASDRILHGTDLRGESHPADRLTAEQVRDIRRRYAEGGVSYADLAVTYGVSRAHIGALVRGEKWKHLAA